MTPPRYAQPGWNPGKDHDPTLVPPPKQDKAAPEIDCEDFPPGSEKLSGAEVAALSRGGTCSASDQYNIIFNVQRLKGPQIERLTDALRDVFPLAQECLLGDRTGDTKPFLAITVQLTNPPQRQDWQDHFGDYFYHAPPKLKVVADEAEVNDRISGKPVLDPVRANPLRR